MSQHNIPAFLGELDPFEYNSTEKIQGLVIEEIDKFLAEQDSLIERYSEYLEALSYLKKTGATYEA